jgi:hypothetical protein
MNKLDEKNEKIYFAKNLNTNVNQNTTKIHVFEAIN